MLESAGADVAFLVARIVFGGVLAFMGLNHFGSVDEMSGYAEHEGLPAPRLAVVGSGLVLLGGGLALADGLAATDATRWIADATFGSLTGSIVVVTLALVAVTVLLSELASNTAVVAIFAPVLITTGPRYAAALGVAPAEAAVFLAVTGALAASFGFALPVATPPNAIAFGTGAVEREHMLRAGVWLDLVMVGLTTATSLLLFGVVWLAVL